MRWGREELRGLTYLHRDRGPQRACLHKTEKPEDPFYSCGEIQNAAHLMASGCVKVKKREWKDIWTDKIAINW